MRIFLRPTRILAIVAMMLIASCGKTGTGLVSVRDLGTYSLTISVTNGTVAKNPDKTAYTAGETVVLTATPNSGYAFIGWSGDTTGSNAVLTVTMNSNKSIVANFQSTSIPLIISITAGSSSVTIGFNGVTGAASYNLYYAAGATVTKSTGTLVSGVTSPKTISGLINGTLYAFAVSAVLTAGGETGLSAVRVAIPQASSTATCQLAVTATNGSVTKSPAKTAYNAGDTVTLTAQANSGYVFAGWSGDTTGYSTTMAIVMNSNKSITALFQGTGLPLITDITPGDSLVTITFNGIAGASSYNLYYISGTTVTRLTGIKVTGITSPKTIPGLINGTPYAFAISAVLTAGGESELSAVYVVIPQLPASLDLDFPVHPVVQ